MRCHSGANDLVSKLRLAHLLISFESLDVPRTQPAQAAKNFTIQKPFLDFPNGIACAANCWSVGLGQDSCYHKLFSEFEASPRINENFAVQNILPPRAGLVIVRHQFGVGRQFGVFFRAGSAVQD